MSEKPSSYINNIAWIPKELASPSRQSTGTGGRSPDRLEVLRPLVSPLLNLAERARLKGSARANPPLTKKQCVIYAWG